MKTKQCRKIKMRDYVKINQMFMLYYDDKYIKIYK